MAAGRRRYENELITVLDVWGTKEEKESVVKPMKNRVLNDSPIERALAAAAKRANIRGSTQMLPLGAFPDAGTTLSSAHLALQRLASLEAPEREELIEEAKEERLRDAQVEEGRRTAELNERQHSELVREFQELQARQLRIVQALRERAEQLQDTMNRLQADTTRLQLGALSREESERKNATPATTRVKLNVGGRRFQTTLATLLNAPESVLAHMFRPTELGVLREAFIDRDGTHFGYVLNFLRDGEAVALPTELDARTALAREARFYHLTRLLWMLEGQPTSTSIIPSYLAHIPTPPLHSPATSPLNSTIAYAQVTPATAPSFQSPLAQTSQIISPLMSPSRSTLSALEYIVEQRRDSAPGVATTLAPSMADASTGPSGRQTISVMNMTASSTSPAVSINPRGGSHTEVPAASSAAVAIPGSGAGALTKSASPPNESLLAGSAMFVFLQSCGLPDDACKQYEKLFSERGIKVADLFTTVSQNTLKDMGVKMGHVMKIMKLKPAGK